jgi:hypothetical protein
VSYGFALATVIVSVATSILAGIILGVIEERYAGISIALLAFAARLQPADEREEFINEALGNLSRIDGRYQTMAHAVGLVLASIRIRLIIAAIASVGSGVVRVMTLRVPSLHMQTGGWKWGHPPIRSPPSWVLRKGQRRAHLGEGLRSEP